MNTWQSEPLHIDGVTVDVKASVEGVTLGQSVDGVYASDTLLEPEQAIAYGNALITAGEKCIEFRAGGAQ